MAGSAVGRVIVYGGKGALGSMCVSHFKANNWWVGSIDLAANETADANVLVKAEDSWQHQTDHVLSEIEKELHGDKVDAILCVAGGWAGGNAAQKDLIKNAELMWKQSMWSSVIATQIATNYLKEGGLIQLTGAKVALDATPGMIGYGMAKAAVHHLVKSLSGENSGLPKDAVALAILPVTLDTPMNRKWMPKADFSSWTKLEYVADLLLQWTSGKDRPNSGSLVQLITSGGKTTLVNE